jgi:hypothetical protein
MALRRIGGDHNHHPLNVPHKLIDFFDTNSGVFFNIPVPDFGDVLIFPAAVEDEGGQLFGRE